MNPLVMFRMGSYVVVLCVGLYFISLMKENKLLLIDKAILEQQNTQQTQFLSSLEKKTQQQKEAINQLSEYLGKKASSDNERIRELNSKSIPSGCEASIVYLKEEANAIHF